MQKTKASADELIALILEGIEDVKGVDINLLDLREIENTVCDYFIICNGTSNTHVNAIVSSVQKKLARPYTTSLGMSKALKTQNGC